MPKRILTREEVAKMLRDWAEGRVTAREVHNWAEELFPGSEDVEYEDWDENDDNSVISAVLGELDMLDMNLRTAEDVPIYLDFLATPPGGYAAGAAEYYRRLDAIDLESRRKLLWDDLLYIRFARRW
jgi:hypothetical protein